METVQIPINEIVIDPEIMPRNELDQGYISDLVEDLQRGVTFPPIILFKEGDKFYPADGCHRLEAARKCGHKTIMAEIREGGRPEATLCSCRANTDHGKRRTNGDKRKAVKKLLQHPEWFCWSDGKIAEECAVSPPFVASLRKKLTTNPLESPILRFGIDGRVINTSNIGKGVALMPPETEPTRLPHGEKEFTVAEENLQSVKLIFPTPEDHHEDVGKTDPPTSEGSLTESTTPPDENKEGEIGQPEGGQAGNQGSPEQIARFKQQIKLFTSKWEEIDKLVDGRKNRSKSAIKRMRRLKEETEQIWIDLHEELEHLIPSK